MTSSPRGLGYRMPAEWEPHRATWLAWPHERSDWPGKFPTIPWVFAEIVRWVAIGETAELVVQGPRAEREARRVLEQSDVPLERVRFHSWRTDRCWTRDSGPSFVRRSRGQGQPGRVAAVHWQFNGWAKYDNYRQDRRLPERMARWLRLPRWTPFVEGKWVVLEGGAIDVDGQGRLMATEECLLRAPQRRNPGLSRARLETVLSEYLGSEEVIWLPGGIQGDDTHGHVDDVARFVGPRRVLAVVTHDRKDPNHRMLARNLRALKSHRPPSGKRLEVRELPLPEPVRFDGQPLPASYANFYVANKAVLVPMFDDPADAEALAILSHEFPGRKVIGIAARDLVWGLGAIHCLTQQEPAKG